VQFGLQFEDVTEAQAQAQANPANPLDKSIDKAPDKLPDRLPKKKRPPVEVASVKTEMPPAASPLSSAVEPKAAGKDGSKPGKPASGGEVVRLDRFRKK
jgi:hypothetical protein